MSQKKLAVSFSGGGVKSAIYLGVLKALESEGIEVHFAGGLSGGALVSAGYAAGLNVNELVDFVHNFALWKAVDMNPFDGVEILDHIKFKQLIEEVLPHNDFSECRIPLTVFATNLETLQAEIIETGEISSAVLASSALPFLLNPIVREGKTLIEGGFSVYYGASHFRKRGAEVILGVDVDGFQNLQFNGHLNTLALGVSTLINQVAQYELELHPVDIAITKFGDSTGMLEFSKLGEKLVDIGFDRTMRDMDRIKQLVFA